MGLSTRSGTVGLDALWYTLFSVAGVSPRRSCHLSARCWPDPATPTSTDLLSGGMWEPLPTQRRNHAAEQWLGVFLEATHDACHEAQGYLHAVSSLEADLRPRAGPVRRGSSADLLLGVLPACPHLDG